MDGVYSFGGERQRDGRPTPINQNDRQFRCGFGTCEVAAPTVQPIINQQDLFNLDFVLFDIDQLRANLTHVSAEVTTAYNNILQWFNDLEQSVALKVQTGDIDMNITLFNELSLIIPKFTLGKKAVNSWYNDYTDMVTELSDLFSEYSNFSAKIQSLSTQNTLIGGIKENVITLAKQNLSKSKAIQRTITKILAVDAKIRSTLQLITFKLSELTSGILRYGARSERKILNLREMANVISSVGKSDSPLANIQAQLSKVINATPLNFTLRTRPPELLPDVDYNPNNIFTTNAMTSDEVLEKLNAFKETTLYTASSKNAVETLRTYVDNQFKNDEIQHGIMISIIDRIKTENVPNLFLATLRAKANKVDNIYLTIDIIRRTLEKLTDQDEIYRAGLNDILETAITTARNSVIEMET